jgi:CheY-like chemotaxis protein
MAHERALGVRQERDRERSIERGFTAHVAKPVSLADLLASVHCTARARRRLHCMTRGDGAA